jgi:hypothetical protein
MRHPIEDPAAVLRAHAFPLSFSIASILARSARSSAPHARKSALRRLDAFPRRKIDAPGIRRRRDRLDVGEHRALRGRD